MSDSGSGSHERGRSSLRFWRKWEKAEKPSEDAHKRHRFSLRFWRESKSREMKKPPEEGREISEFCSPRPLDEGSPVAQKLNPDAEETLKIEEAQEGPPSTTDYALDATKQTINLLKSIAELAPVPLVKDVLELGLKIIETFEAVNDVQSKVTVLKQHIAGFLLVIAKVSKDSNAKPDDGISATKLSDELKADLEQLKGCLVRISKQLDAIRDQNAFLTGLLSQPNLDVIQDCESHFQAEISRFQTLQSLHAAQDLAIIRQQLMKLYGITEGIVSSLEETQQKVAVLDRKVTDGFKDLTAMLTKNATEGSTVLSRMPRAPNVFFGRDHVVQRIAEQLTCNDRSRTRVCLLGPGGMGKTSTALAIMEHKLVTQHFAQQYRFWVPFVSANSPTLFLDILFRQVRAERKTGDPLEDIIATLQETTDPCIIFLDNFETPWHSVEGSESSIQLVLQALDDLPHLSILITMRSEFSPFESWLSEKLEQIDPEDSRRIYTTIDPAAESSPDLGDLVEALGHLPYAITLMASRGKRSFSNPTQLLKEWKETGTSMLSRTRGGIDHSICLSVDAEFVRNSPGALQLLQILSMLPTGLYHEHLSIWADGWQSEAIDTLRDAALVLAREFDLDGATRVHLFVLPVVQSYVKHGGRIPKEVEQQVYTSCYQFLARNSITIQGPNDPNFIQHALAIASQEANIQALLTDIVKHALADADPPPYTSPTSPNPVTREQWLDALSTFSWYQRWTKPRPEISQHVVTLAKAIGNTQSEAFALFCLGSIHFALAKYRDAIEAFARAQLLFESLDDDIMALRSESIHVDSGMQILSPPEAYKLIDNYRARWEAHASAEHPSLKSWFLFRNGYFYWWMNQYTEAIAKLEVAKQLFGQLHPPCKFEMAFSDYWIARSYAARGWVGDGEAALSAINSAISMFQSLYGQGLIGVELADSYIAKALILKGLNRWDGELDVTLQVALRSFQELGISREIGLALAGLAEVYVRRKDWPAAKLAYEEAIRKCIGLEDMTSKLQVQYAQHNLQYIAHISAKDILADSGEDDEEIGFLMLPRY